MGACGSTSTAPSTPVHSSGSPRPPRERVDFIEDPCPYDPHVWRALRKETGLPLALDREVATEGVDVLIVKPAIRSPDRRSSVLSTVVTSYMDHPVGQLHAAVVAARTATNPRCGLVTHLLYEPDAFSERL